MSLQNLCCEHNKVQDYVACWRSGISCLQSTNFPFSVCMYINDFVQSLPHTLAFATLRAMLPSHLDNMRDNYDLGPFITVTNDTMDLEIAFHTNAGLNVPCHPPHVQASLSQTSAPSPKTVGTSSSLVPPVEATHTNRSSLFCNNCKKPGHINLTCFKEGGSLAG